MCFDAYDCHILANCYFEVGVPVFPLTVEEVAPGVNEHKVDGTFCVTLMHFNQSVGVILGRSV